MGTTTAVKLAAQAAADERAVPCPVCGEHTLAVLLTHADIEAEHRWLKEFYRQRTKGTDDELKDRAEFTQSEPTNIVRCNTCGTLLRDPQPTPAALERLYASDTYGQETLRQLSLNQRQFFEGKVSLIEPWLPEAPRVLEIGAFVGGFLQAAKRRGWNATGVDIGAETVAFMQGAGLHVIQGDVLEVGLAENKWDGVLIWNTFDQLPEPAGVLQRAAALLKPGGLLVLRVPNGKFEDACLQLRKASKGSRREAGVLRAQAYNNFLTFPYLTGYTPDSIRLLLKQHGFHVRHINGDTILQLADKKTVPWAVEEEKRYKRAVMRYCRKIEAESGEVFYPWLDIIARKT